MEEECFFIINNLAFYDILLCVVASVLIHNLH
jgi:hypothetical protein